MHYIYATSQFAARNTLSCKIINRIFRIICIHFPYSVYLFIREVQA